MIQESPLENDGGKSVAVTVEGKAHDLMDREATELDLSLFDDGSKFTELGKLGLLLPHSRALS